jgi:hypothetical protein
LISDTIVASKKGEFLNNVNRIRDLSSLVKESKVVVFHTFLGDKDDRVLTNAIVQEEMKEWLNLDGTINLRKPIAVVLCSAPQEEGYFTSLKRY